MTGTGIREPVASRLREIELTFRRRQEAAEAAGVAKSTFQGWVESKAAPPFEALVRLCRVSGHSLEWLADGAEPKLRPPTGATTVNAESATLIDGLLWDDIFNVVSDIAVMNAQPIALARHHQIVHDIYNRAARFATDAERNAAITVLVVDRVAAAYQAQTAQERLEARRRKPPGPQPAPDKSDPEEPV